MLEHVVRFVGFVIWEFILYGVGRLVVPPTTLGQARAETIDGEPGRLGWFGVGRGPDGVRIVSANLTGLIGGSLLLVALLVFIAVAKAN